MNLQNLGTPSGNEKNHEEIGNSKPILKWNLMDYNSRAVRSLLYAGDIEHSEQIIEWPFEFESTEVYP